MNSRISSVIPVIAASFAACLLASSPGHAAGNGAQRTAPSGRTTPVVSNDAQVQRELRNLDQYLDVHPQLEQLLERNLDRLDEETFILHNPEWADELQRQPGLGAALKSERNFLLHRIINRSANIPLIRNDVIQFDQFLDAHPDINRAVQEKAERLVDPHFLAAHPPLAQFYDQHPALSTILMEVGGGVNTRGSH